VLVAPILPGLSDAPEQLEAVTRACNDAGAVSITRVMLHLRPGVKEVFLAHLAQTHPHLVDHYRRLYGSRTHLPRSFRRSDGPPGGHPERKNAESQLRLL
jgi:DNA repair photolyase